MSAACLEYVERQFCLLSLEHFCYVGVVFSIVASVGSEVCYSVMCIQQALETQ